MLDISSLKVPIFAGKNDVPKAPTAEDAGNGPDLIARFNSLIDSLAGNSNSSGQLVLEQNTQWFVDSSNGSDENDGLTEQEPFGSLQKASSVAASYFNPSSYLRQIYLMAGSHNGALLKGFISQGENDYIEITGLATGPEQVIINSPVQIFKSGPYSFSNLAFQCPDRQRSLIANNARIKIGNVLFTGSTLFGTHITGLNQSFIEVVESYSILGNIGFHIFLDSMSFMDLTLNTSEFDRTIFVKNDLNFGTFASINKGSYLYVGSTNFFYPDDNVNNTTGRKYYLSGNSTICAVGRGEDIFPGNAIGQSFHSSIYC